VNTVNRCARGTTCAAAERATGPDGEPMNDPDGKPRKIGAICDRPLCDLCEQKVSRVLDESPALYRDVRNHTLLKSAAVRSEMVSASRGSPMPLNARALDLGEQLWWLLCSWEDAVRAIARLTPAQREGKREGRQVQDAATLLNAHLTAWIAAPTIGFQMNTGHDPHTDAATEQSGVDAAIALLDWRTQVRQLPGLDRKATKAVRRYEQRCPACGVRAITHRAGDDLMQCQNCGATQPYLPTLPREADYVEKAS
jgi:hypothetical protein